FFSPVESSSHRNRYEHVRRCDDRIDLFIAGLSIEKIGAVRKAVRLDQNFEHYGNPMAGLSAPRSLVKRRRAPTLLFFSAFFCSPAPQAFFRPDRRFRTPSRAEAVKVGRRSAIKAHSDVSRPRLDSFEHGGRLEDHGPKEGNAA